MLSCGASWSGSNARCPSDRDGSTTYTLSPSASYLVIVGLTVFCFLLCARLLCSRRLIACWSRYWDSRRSGAESDRTLARMQRREAAMQEVIVAARVVTVQGLPEMVVGPAGREGECAVCLDEFKPGNVLLTLPCMHIFHRTCAEQWLLEPSSHGRCPLCKAPISARNSVQL